MKRYDFTMDGYLKLSVNATSLHTALYRLGRDLERRQKPRNGLRIQLDLVVPLVKTKAI